MSPSPAVMASLATRPHAALGGAPLLPLTYGAALRLWVKADPANVTIVGGDVTDVVDLSTHDHASVLNFGLPTLVDPDASYGSHASFAFAPADEAMLEYPLVAQEADGFVPANGVTLAVIFDAAASGFQVVMGLYGAGSDGKPRVELSIEGTQIKISHGNGDGGDEGNPTVIWDYASTTEVVIITVTPATLVGGVATGAAVDVAGEINVYRGTSSTPVATVANTTTLRSFTMMTLGTQYNGGYPTGSRLNGTIAEAMVINDVLTGAEAAAMATFILADKV